MVSHHPEVGHQGSVVVPGFAVGPVPVARPEHRLSRGGTQDDHQLRAYRVELGQQPRLASGDVGVTRVDPCLLQNPDDMERVASRQGVHRSGDGRTSRAVPSAADGPYTELLTR